MQLGTSGTYFGEMALLSDRTRSATLRARTAMEVLIIPKADFNKLRQSVPAFGNVFTELAARRAAAGPRVCPQTPACNSGQRVLF